MALQESRGRADPEPETIALNLKLIKLCRVILVSQQEGKIKHRRYGPLKSLSAGVGCNLARSEARWEGAWRVCINRLRRCATPSRILRDRRPSPTPFD